MSTEKYSVSEYPRSRVATFDVGRLGGKKHHIAGFFEVDITAMRIKLKEAKALGRRLSFTSCLLKMIGETVKEYPEIHAVNHRSRKQVIFDNIDISLPVEREVDGVKVPLALLVRAVNTKTTDEINAEIQEAIRRPVGSGRDYVLSEQKHERTTGFFFFMPQWFRLIVWRMILRNPFTIKRNMGTIIVTNIGSAGKFAGWILPKSIHNLAFGIGSIYRKPWVVNDKIEIREILHLTVLFDHDVVDGAPAARFTEKLVRNIEKPINF